MAMSDSDKFDQLLAAAQSAQNPVASSPNTMPTSDSDKFDKLLSDAQDREDQAKDSTVAVKEQPEGKQRTSPDLSTGTGIAKNALAGVGDAISGIGNVLSDPFGNLVGKPLATAGLAAYDYLAPKLGYERTSDNARNMLLGDNVPQPGTRFTNAVADAAGGTRPDEVMANGPVERLTRKVVGNGLLGYLTGGLGTGAAGAEGAVVGDLASQAVPEYLKPVTELAGNVAGSTVGTGVARPAGNFLKDVGGSNIVIPEPIAQLADTAKTKYGIPITAPDMVGNTLIKTVNDQSSRVPGSGAGPIKEKQLDGFMKGVSDTMGAKELDSNGNQTTETAKLLTPDVMKANADRLKAQFEDVANKSPPIMADEVNNDLGRILTDAKATPLGVGGQRQVQNLVDLVKKHFQNYQLDDPSNPGQFIYDGPAIGPKTYQELTRAGTPLDLATKASDPNIAHYAERIKDALDGGLQDSLNVHGSLEQQYPGSTGFPDANGLADKLAETREQWRNMKTVEPLVQASTDGRIPPAQLLAKVNAASRRFDGSTEGTAYEDRIEPDKSSLLELGRIGSQFFKSAPNSGTADRMLVNKLLEYGGGGAALGTAIHSPLAATIGTLGTYGAANALGRYVRSEGVANRIIQNNIGPEARARLSAEGKANSVKNALLRSPRAGLINQDEDQRQ